MSVKLFILGRPGSGKSYAARHIQKMLDQQSKVSKRFNDYHILLDMFSKDAKQELFRPTKLGGFDVLQGKSFVFDDALQKLEEHVRAYLSTANNDAFCLIEFARKNYDDAFHLFHPDFLYNSHIVFIKANINICRQRIKERLVVPQTEDDHYISHYALRTYYNRQIKPNASLKVLGLDKKFDTIDNNGTRDVFIEQLERCVRKLLERVPLDAKK